MKAVKKPLVMPDAAGSSQGDLGRCSGVWHWVKMSGVYPKMGKLLEGHTSHGNWVVVSGVFYSSFFLGII